MSPVVIGTSLLGPVPESELSMGWVDPRLDWVRLGRDFAVFDGLSCVGSNMTKVLYFLMITQHTIARDRAIGKYKGYEKLAFFNQYHALFRKRYKIRP